MQSYLDFTTATRQLCQYSYWINPYHLIVGQLIKPLIFLVGQTRRTGTCMQSSTHNHIHLCTLFSAVIPQMAPIKDYCTLNTADHVHVLYTLLLL